MCIVKLKTRKMYVKCSECSNSRWPKKNWVVNKKTDENEHIWLTLAHLLSFFYRLVSTVAAEWMNKQKKITESIWQQKQLAEWNSMQG